MAGRPATKQQQEYSRGWRSVNGRKRRNSLPSQIETVGRRKISLLDQQLERMTIARPLPGLSFLVT